jgi:hypothetical protein
MVNQQYPGLALKKCKVCNKEKYAYFDYCNNNATCKQCQNVQKKAKRYASSTCLKNGIKKWDIC